MKEHVIIYFLISFLIFSGCSVTDTNQSEKDPSLIEVPASEVSVIGTSTEDVSFEFKGGIPVPCYSFEGAIIEREDHIINVKVQARYPKGILCIQVISTLQVSPLTVEVPENGNYTFRFWRGDKEVPLVIKVEVP